MSLVDGQFAVAAVVPDLFAETAHQIVPSLLTDGVTVHEYYPQVLVPAHALMVAADWSVAASTMLNWRLPGAV